MIELSLSTALMLYLGVTLSIVLGIWGYSHYKGKVRQILPPEQELLLCEYCHFAYLKDSLKTVTQCPQCGSYNKNR